MGGVKFAVHVEGLDRIADKMAQACTKAEHTVAQQVRNDTSPFVPALTGSLDNRTRVDGTNVIYPGPYARYLYYGKYMVDEQGNGPRLYVDGAGNEVIRYPYGSKLHATDRDLVFTKTVHPQAQAHWFDASKAQNLDKWERVAKEAIGDEFK